VIDNGSDVSIWFDRNGDGHDSLSGDSGSDLLYGGNENDTLLGGDSNDSLYGDDGSDSLLGEGGNDRLLGGDGNDYMNGGIGADFLWGGNQDDTLYGGDQGDRLYGQAGEDFLYGENGKDSLEGGLGNEWIEVGIDNDTLIGGDQDDSLWGGLGADSFIFTVHAGNGESWVDSVDLMSVDVIHDAESMDILVFDTGGAVTSVADLEAYVHVIDNGSDVSIWFDRNGDGQWVGDYEDSIVLKGMGIAPNTDGIESLAELQNSINVLVV
jgi:Ca2+-binding RTX toxin-like protein